MPLTDALGALPHLRTIDRFKADPVGTQERLLRRLLEKARDTEWGRKLDFRGALAEDDVVGAFQARSPIRGYEPFRDAVARMRQGAPDVLWPGVTRHYAVSSGTASAGKIIPLSLEMLDLNRQFTLTTALNYARSSGSMSFVAGKLLSVPGRIDEDPDNPGVFVGEMSGLMYLFGPWWVKRYLQAVDQSVLFLPRWEDKLKAMVDRTLSMNIKSMAMVPSWAVVFFPMLIEAYNRKHGASVTTVQEVWPEFRVFFSGAVALSSYLELMQEQIGSDQVDFIESYGASEGVFSFQTQASDTDMLLHLDNGVFFEFTRMDEEEETARRYTIRDVEVGVRYRLHVSSCSGLWSYGVGDVVKFTSLEPHRIVVAGRTSEMLDRYGEAVFGGEARQALERACAGSGARFRDYHIAPVAPDGTRPPRHQWLIEFDQPPGDVGALASAIDTYLQDVNRHYVIRRECGAFDAPEIVALAPGTFLSWLKTTRGKVSAQTKVPRMSEDRAYADGILDTLETIGSQTS
ncbi:MAG: GH3 auxin-responsive promoter family protein [Rhodothermales bacterium]|nr:GH3 auxin-responsive promoter family protein [Rhodothermales bacterium]MBO6778395.1 GH3 auxin-responsive promoter family protein [Rhodothermales bacterium]